jgi:hypothetical protein
MASSDHRSDSFLRASLLGNAVFSIVSGAIAVAFASRLGEFMGLAPVVLAVIGVGVFGFGWAILWNARRETISLRQARLTVILDLMWIVTGAIVIVGFPGLMTAGGEWLLAAVSTVVGVFAVLQGLGLRSAGGVPPRRLVTEIQIDASPHNVWNVLTGLSEYQDWNPFVVAGSGEVAVGEEIEIRMRQSEGNDTTFKPIVTEATSPSTFEWLGRLGIPGLFAGRHRFDLLSSETGTRVVHSEEFSGVLVPLLWNSLDRKTRGGFEAMNVAMKERVEAGTPPMV